MHKSAVVLALILCGCRAEDARPSPDDHSCRPHRVALLQAYCAGESPSGGPCKGIPKAFAVACADGCFLHTCGPAVACKEGPALCEGSCDDPATAPFWRDLTKAKTVCHRNDRVTEPPPRDCVIKETEKLCPALSGTRWFERIPDFGQ